MSDSTSTSSPESIPSTTEDSVLPEPHPVNYLLLPPEDWLEPEFTEMLHAFDRDMESLWDLLNGLVQGLFRDALNHEEWGGEVGTGMMMWVYNRYPFIPAEMVAGVFPKVALDAHEEIKRSTLEHGDKVFAELRLNELRTMPYKEYLKTDHWQTIRDRAREDAGNRCQLCNSDKNLHVHHKTYARRGEEMPDDVIVLCAGCHKHFHDKLKVQS